VTLNVLIVPVRAARSKVWTGSTYERNQITAALSAGLIRSKMADWSLHVTMERPMEKDLAERLAKTLAVLCVRNTFLEDLHAGIYPSSTAGDYSDVKVVTPYGEIPWSNLSRFNDDEMRQLMKEVVNKIYTVLLRMDDVELVQRMDAYARLSTRRWDAPENLTDWFSG
jgi:hypothetical protein